MDCSDAFWNESRTNTEEGPMDTKRNTAAIYVRRSAADSANKDEDAFSRSLVAQERECLAWAERQGLTVTEVYRDKTGTSASHFKTNRRPEMERALADIGVGYHTLIVWALDRATRKGMAEIGSMVETIEKAGGRMVSVTDGVDTDDPTARLIMAIRSEMARDEMDKLHTRVCRGKDEQRRRSEFLGGSVPFGWLRNPGAPYGVSLDHEAAPVIVAMVDRLIEGATLAETCRWLNGQGHLTQNGAKWTPPTMGRFVRSVHLIGHRRYGDGVATDADGNPVEVVEPVISPAKFARVDKVLTARRNAPADPNRPTRFRGKASVSLLGGLLKCAGCDGKMTMRQGSAGYKYYGCPLCKPWNAVKASIVEPLVARQALLFVASLDPASTIADEVARRMLATFSPEQVTRRSEIVDLLPVIQNKMAKFRKENLNGLLDDDEYQRLQDDATMKINALRDELATLPESKGDMGILLDLTQASDDPDGDLVGPGSAWAAMEHHLQREILRVLIDEITINKSDYQQRLAANRTLRAKGERPPRIVDDIEGRTVIEFCTEDNVIHLANRPERVKGYSTANKVAATA
jgi:site-specific DNA recombinase